MRIEMKDTTLTDCGGGAAVVVVECGTSMTPGKGASIKYVRIRGGSRKSGCSTGGCLNLVV